MNYQKLEYPQLIEINSELGFIIATEIDVSLVNNGLIIMKGFSYDYENGEVVKGNITEVHLSTTENGIIEVDEKGKYID